LLDELENGKDKIVGKLKESAGQIANAKGLELSGKLQIMKADINDDMEGMRDKLLEKANNFVDQAQVSQRK
jgi:uncharacterized protein YjbJ (UPF0337 family)